MPYCSISFWFDVNSMTFWFRIVSLYLSKCVIYRQRTLLNSLTNNWVKVLLCWWYDLPILCCFFTLQNCIVPSMCFLTYWCQLFQCCLCIFSRVLVHMHPPEIFSHVSACTHLCLGIFVFSPYACFVQFSVVFHALNLLVWTFCRNYFPVWIN